MILMAVHMALEVAKGRSQFAAAEIVSDTYWQGKPEPDTMIRRINAAGLDWIITE